MEIRPWCVALLTAVQLGNVLKFFMFSLTGDFLCHADPKSFKKMCHQLCWGFLDLHGLPKMIRTDYHKMFILIAFSHSRNLNHIRLSRCPMRSHSSSSWTPFRAPTRNEFDRDGMMVMMFLLPQWLNDDETRMREDKAASSLGIWHDEASRSLGQITQFHHL